ncbi:M28 family peptidase [Nannocystaceae bacterium ST9]
MTRAWVCALACVLGSLAGCSQPGVHEAPASTDPSPPSADVLREHVEVLAGQIGGRGLDRPEQLDAAAQYIRDQWQAQGYAVRRLAYRVDGREVANLEIELPGRDPELVVIGAHYDTCEGNPGADDNASGVAALLELSRLLAGERFDRTIRLVAFVNEEPPHFRDDAAMGSRVYARGLREAGHEIAAMLSLESIGYYSDEPESQHYPAIIAPLYPDAGNFVAVVGKTGSRPLVRQVVELLESHGEVPVESIAAPASITGIDWSDHASFWAQGWSQAVMITDTATFRNPHYHRMTDVPDTLDYRRLAALTRALAPTIRDLAKNPSQPSAAEKRQSQ